MKTIPVPVQNFVTNGNLLTQWMGDFWSRLYENVDLVKGVQQGQAILVAQLYLNFLESIALIDRNTVPVFHRERWKPLVIRKSQANTGSATLLRAGMDPTPMIGKQTANEFQDGVVFNVGGNAQYLNTVSYPVEPGLSEICTQISDNIVNPKVVLIKGKDFIFQDDTIVFLRQNDPFALDAFPKRELNDDQETLVWASDVLIDKQYAYENLGYVLGVLPQSEEFYTKMINALWDLYNHGTPISIVQSCIGAMLGEPTVAHATEIVETITSNADYMQVITNREVYNVSKLATLRSACVVGATLHMGDFLTESVRLYETLDPMKLDAVSEFGERFRTDVYSLFFDKSMLRSRVQFGVGASYAQSNITVDSFDTQGNPRLKFDLFGDPDDLVLFWSDFWQYLDAHGMTSETCLQAYLYDNVLPVEGAVVGSVPPLEFFLRYFMRANAMVVVVEKAKLAAPPTGINSVAFLRLLRPVIPAHVLLLVVEIVSPEVQEYDLSDVGSEYDRMLAKMLSETAEPGGPSTAKMTYRDRRPIVRQIPNCRS